MEKGETADAVSPYHGLELRCYRELGQECMWLNYSA